MRSILLERGSYLGETVQRRETENLLITLSNYESDRRFAKHVHVDPGFFLLLRGQHREEDAMGSRHQRPATVFFHGTRQPHSTELGPEGMVGVNISIRNAWLGELDIREEAISSSPSSVEVESAALRLTAAAFCAGSTDAWVESLAIELISAGCPSIESASPPRWLRNVRQEISSRFREPLSLSALAREASVSPVHMARTFRRHYGCSVSQYLQRVRVVEAARTIGSGSTIGNAAFDTGFADQSHLTRAMRFHVGMTPGVLSRLGHQKVSIVQE